MNSSTRPLTTALGGGGWSTTRPGLFIYWKDPVPVVQEAGWAPGPVWTDAANLATTGICSPDRPARGEWAYRIRISGLRWREGSIKLVNINVL